MGADRDRLARPALPAAPCGGRHRSRSRGAHQRRGETVERSARHPSRAPRDDRDVAVGNCVGHRDERGRGLPEGFRLRVEPAARARPSASVALASARPIASVFVASAFPVSSTKAASPCACAVLASASLSLMSTPTADWRAAPACRQCPSPSQSRCAHLRRSLHFMWRFLVGDFALSEHGDQLAG